MSKKSYWERIYHVRLPDEVSWYQTEPTLSLSMIENAGISKQSPIIDVGGGSSFLVRNLFDCGYRNLTVLDISSKALEYAKKQMGTEAMFVTWIEEDIIQFVSTKLYDLWHDRSVFNFLTEAGERAEYVDTLKRSLNPGGTVIIASFAIDGPSRCSGLDVVRYDAVKLSEELGTTFRLKEQEKETHITPGNREQKFSYFRFTYNL